MRTRVGVYAVAVHEAQILLTQLAEHTNQPGHWTLPGGGMDYGEQPTETLLRELNEETGLSGQILGLLHARSFSLERRGTRKLSVQLMYRVRARGTPRVLEEGGSTAQAAWFALDEVPGLLRVPQVDVAIEAWREVGALE